MKISILLLVLIGITSTQSLSCKNDKNQDESYVSMIKYPSKEQTDSKYSFYGVEENVDKFVTKNSIIDGKGGALDNILSQVTKTMDLIAWNDEHPDGKTTSGGAHSKGLIAYDSKTDTGFLLTHSVPKYPNIGDDNKIDSDVCSSQDIYGQSFICLSLDGSNLDKLAEGYLTAEVSVYHSVYKKNSYENLQKLSEQMKQDSESNFLQLRETSSDITGTLGKDLIIKYKVAQKYPFTSFFKAPSNHVDLMKDIIAPTLKENMYQESWGRPYAKSDCSGEYFVKNIIDIKTERNQWNDTEDHSKWAISETKGWACLGGMNHMISQQRRGGSFHCTQDSNLWNALHSVISHVEQC